MSATAITSPDESLLSSGLAHRYKLTINAAPKTIVATARIDQTSFAYPISEVTVKNTVGWSGVKVGQAVWIGTTPGAWDITAGVVKKAPTSTTLYFDAKSLGDPGYSRAIRQGLANDHYITILKHRPPWGLLSSIRAGVFYKAWDVAYVDEGSNPYPIARIGKHRNAKADGSGVATLKFTADPITWGTKTISTHLWNLDGGTVVSGSITSTEVTAQFAPGFYVVEYTVQDSGGKSTTAFRYVWVNPNGDSGSFASFGSQNIWEINRDSQEVIGRGIDLTLSGELTPDDIFPGQPFLLTEEATFGGVQLSDEDSRVWNYLGYVNEVSPSRQKVTRRVGLKLVSPLMAARLIPAAPQLVSETATPVNWAEATSALTNPIGGIWYILQHHAPTLLAAHDFYFSESVRANREQSLKFAQDDIAAQIMSFDETIPGSLGCRSDGTFVLTPSPVHMNNTDRNTLPIKFIWDGGSIVADPGLQYLYNFPQRVGQVKALCFTFDGATNVPYASLAPGKVQAQGKGKQQVTFMIPFVDAATDQARLNELSGHEHAAQNAPTAELGFTANRNLDIAEPCDRNCWHYLNIPPELDPYGVGFATRALSVRVQRNWKRNGRGALIKTIRQEFVVETFGQPGVTIPVEKDGWEDWVTDGWAEQLAVDFDPKEELVDTAASDPEGGGPGAGEYLVNFGASGWPDYNVSSSLGGVPTVTTGGNPGNCAFVENTETSVFIGQSYNTNLVVEVVLDVAHTISSVEFDFSLLYDSGDFTGTPTYQTVLTVGGYGGGTHTETLMNGFQTRAHTPLSEAGVTNLFVEVKISGNCAIIGDVVTQLKLDNIRVGYSA